MSEVKITHKYGRDRRLKCCEAHLSTVRPSESTFWWDQVTCLLCIQHRPKESKLRVEKAAVLKDVV